MVAGSIYLVVSRRDVLRSEHSLDSLFSREAVFLLNNVVLVGLCFVIFWGTFFPLISKAATGTSASVGAPWFDRYTVPLALMLVLLSGVGPVIAWRRATLANARRNFALPLAAAALMAIAAYTVVPIGSSPTTVVLFCGAVFVFAGDRPGVLARLARARRASSRESPPRRARLDGPPQPPPLRRLHRAHRHRRALHRRRRVLDLPARSSTLTLRAGPVGARRRVHDALRRARPAPSTTIPTTPGATLTLGAVLRVTRDGHYVTTLRPQRRLLPERRRSLPGQRRLEPDQRRRRQHRRAATPRRGATSGRRSPRRRDSPAGGRARRPRPTSSCPTTSPGTDQVALAYRLLARDRAALPRTTRRRCPSRCSPRRW